MLGSSIFQIGNFPKLQTAQDKESKPKTSFTIAVEGNIGSGKTTFLDYFKKHPKVEENAYKSPKEDVYSIDLKPLQVLPEPVDKWKCIHGFNSLDMMYKDAARWSLAFQSYVTLTMVEHHENDEKPTRVKMIERSIYSARYCFIENLHQGGLMPDIDYNILNEWHDWLNQNAQTNIDLIVYLRATPQNCHNRIHKRNRDEEKGVPIEYLNSLHKLHEEWLVEKKRGELPAPVMVIDADINLEDLYKKIVDLEPQILSGDYSSCS